MSSLPVIDLSGSADGSEVARAIDEACQTAGFFSVIGHGIAPELRDRLEEVRGWLYRRQWVPRWCRGPLRWAIRLSPALASAGTVVLLVHVFK